MNRLVRIIILAIVAIICAALLLVTMNAQNIDMTMLRVPVEFPLDAVPGVLLITDAHAQTATVDYYKWIGPTVNGTPTATQIDNTGYNMTTQALFGGDARNASLDNFSGEGIIGGLAWPYNSIPGILIIIVGFVLGLIMYIKHDGDLLIPGGILIMCGILSGGSNLAFAVPWEMILFSTLAVVLGIGAIIIQLLLGRGE